MEVAGGGSCFSPLPLGFCTNSSFVKGTISDVHIKQGPRRWEKAEFRAVCGLG